MSDYTELRTLAESHYDLQQFRIAESNKVRSNTVRAVGAAIEQYERSEKALALELKRVMRRTVSPSVRAWQQAQRGVGELLLARLLGQTGDIRTAVRWWWEGTGTDRVLVAGDPFERTVSQLWSYCGHGDPKRVKRKGMSKEDAIALGNPTAKFIVHLLAESCVKAGIRKTDEDAGRIAISPYGEFYLAQRSKYSEQVHTGECVRCGPSGKPALDGSLWSLGHQHGAALRNLGKEILRDLWVVSGD